MIFYEHKVREYASCCALKAELERKNISVRICHNGGPKIWRYRLFSHPRIAIGPNAIETSIGNNWNCLNNYTDYLRGTVRYFINLQVEQIFSDNEMANYNIVKRGEWSDRIIYICWGDERRKQLLRRGVLEKQIIVTGALHLDFLSPPLFDCYYTKKELASLYGLDISKKWVLFISSYTYANMNESDLNWIMKVREENEQNHLYSQIQNLIESSTTSRDITLKWIKKYLQKERNSIFIYRPHPGEQINQKMQQMTIEFANQFVIIPSEILQNWIIVSDSVDTWITTAIVDLWKLRKPCFLIQPIPPPDSLVPSTINCNNAVHTYQDFEESHRNEKRMIKTAPWDEEKLRRYYANSSMPAYQTISRLVEKLLAAPPPPPIKSVFNLSSLVSLHHLRQMALAFFACFRIRLSRIFPLLKSKLKRLEDAAIRDKDVFFTSSERAFYKRIEKQITNNRI